MTYRETIRLNRTSVGLKLWNEVPPGGAGVGPQSNQRGIETGGRLDQQAAATGLNRTSVGLKRAA